MDSLLRCLATPEEIEGFKGMVAQFKLGYPNWDGQPISPETSVKMMFEVIDKFGIEQTGAFLSHKGDKEWL